MREANPQTRVTVGQTQPAAPPPPPPPTNRTELRALMEKRSELDRQLESVTDRREELASQFSDAQPSARAGLEGRIRALDERAARLEQDILHADDAIAIALAGGVTLEPGRATGTSSSDGPDFRNVDRDEMFGGLLAFVLVGLFLYRWGWARAKSRFSRAGAPVDTARMEQLQNAVDAIAVEVERISEGQRYVTKMLNEGSAQPVGMEAGENVLVRRKAT